MFSGGEGKPRKEEGWKRWQYSNHEGREGCQKEARIQLETYFVGSEKEKRKRKKIRKRIKKMGER